MSLYATGDAGLYISMNVFNRTELHRDQAMICI